MKNQSGRSMIEMLGVLAIIGVLSIGGVATFQYAMTKDKANKVIYDINLLREQTVTNAADIPAENFEPESGYQMSSQYGEGGIVSIMIDDLDKDVCERLLSMRFEDLRFLHAEQNTDILNCGEDMAFRAVFGLGDNAIIDEDACVIPCDSNHECYERRCCPKLADGICSATASGCPTQVADDDTPCGTNQRCKEGECVCGLECEGEFVPNSACDACECGLECANGGTPNESCTACENCDNSWGGTYCDVCEQNCQNSGTPIQNCSACECVNSWTGDDCETCDLTCQNGGTANEDCSACDCPSNWTGDNCDVCNISASNCGDVQYFDSEHCLCVCGTEGYTGYYCSYSCPSATTGRVSGLSKSACEACGNTFWSRLGCYGCGYSNTIYFPTEAEAEACENACAGTEYERIAVGTNCHRATEGCPLATSSKSYMSKSDCEECGNAFWKDGYCYGCGNKYSIEFATEAEAEACVSACADSGNERTADGNYCYLATTPPDCPSATSIARTTPKSVCETCDNTVWRNGYGCFGCGYKYSVDFATEAEAEACVSACADSGYERTAEGRYCYLATNTGCPSAGSSKEMSKSVCETCDNTFWSKGTCYGCGSIDISFDTEAEAEACVSACADSGYELIAEGTYCRLPNPTCPSEGMEPIPDSTKSLCEKCWGAFWSHDGCYTCTFFGAILCDTEAEAEACVSACAGTGYERIAEGRYCYLAPNTNCPSETTSTSNMTKSVCETCDNTVWGNGNCYGCGYSSSISFPTEAEAEACVAACADSGYPREVDKSGDLYYCSRK